MNERYEEFVDVIHVYEGKNGECAFVNDGETFGILTENDEFFEANPYIPGSMYTALRALYGEIPLTDDREFIPIKIAVAGKPVMATYQYMSNYHYYKTMEPRRDEGKRHLAEQLGVSRETVQKYFRRVADDASEIKVGGFRDRHYWF